MWVVTNLDPQEGLAIYHYRMKVDESFKDLKSLLGLHPRDDKRQDYLEKVIALVLLASGLGPLAGEEIRDRAYSGKGRWKLFSGPFVLLKQLGQVSNDVLWAALRQVTIFLRQMLLPPVPTHA